MEEEGEEKGLSFKKERKTGGKSTQKPTRRKELSAEAQTWGEGKERPRENGSSGSFRGSKSE